MDASYFHVAHSLKGTIKAANLTQAEWAQSQGITPDGSTKLVKNGAIVVNEIVYRKTKYRVETRTKGEIK